MNAAAYLCDLALHDASLLDDHAPLDVARSAVGAALGRPAYGSASLSRELVKLHARKRQPFLGGALSNYHDLNPDISIPARRPRSTRTAAMAARRT